MQMMKKDKIAKRTKPEIHDNADVPYDVKGSFLTLYLDLP